MEPTLTLGQGNVKLIVVDGRHQQLAESVLEKELWGDVEAAAEAFDVVLVELAFAAGNLGDDAGRASVAHVMRDERDKGRAN